MDKHIKDQKRFELFQQYTVKCKCGCSVTIMNRRKKVLCSWCGRMVYLDKKQEFNDKMKIALKKVKV